MLCQLENNPPEIRLFNELGKRGGHPTPTVDVVRRGEALATFDRDLIIHFQKISKAAALHVRAWHCPC